MFASKTKALVKNLGAEGDLIDNDNVNEKIEMLTLVKVRQRRFWPVIKYTTTDLTLLDLLEEPNYSPEYTEEVLAEDFNNLIRICGNGSVGAGAHDVELKASAETDTVDGVSPITLKKKTVDIEKLRKNYTDKKVKKKFVDMLKLKEDEKLTFVYQSVYNTTPVKFFDIAINQGSTSAAFKIYFQLCVTGKKKEKTTFIVPEESTFAYSLMEITTEDGTLGIPPRTRNVRRYNEEWWRFSSDGEGDCETFQRVKGEIKMKEVLLQPLADLSAPTRDVLLKTLHMIVETRNDLSLLVDQLSTGASDGPQSQHVSSFMDLLKASNASTAQKDAIDLLVSAMDTLPDSVPALLTTCSPDTLRVLNQLVSSLGKEAKLPESLPPPLQEEGKLRWAAELLCSTGGTLQELNEQWFRPKLPAGALLEVLCLVVRGLSIIQHIM
ncbi:uncharacterized protein LOC127359790 [Dicentrarchus labrax]|uniref:uncharacterized protein LOC127359790 n=1 Tax=Dicentrarchus labrax TaxID=13489 RepID=UPI0021F64037|nr:uncharacterized protein LOC127359790 [Dicentrarchus labrax]